MWILEMDMVLRKAKNMGRYGGFLSHGGPSIAGWFISWIPIYNGWLWWFGGPFRKPLILPFFTMYNRLITNRIYHLQHEFIFQVDATWGDYPIRKEVLSLGSYLPWGPWATDFAGKRHQIEAYTKSTDATVEDSTDATVEDSKKTPVSGCFCSG